MDTYRWSEEGEGELTEEALREKLRSEGFSVFKYTYPPGTRFSPHSHDVDKVDAILQGRFRVEMNGESAVLGPGEWVYVPAGEEHAAEVVGDKSVVSLDAARR